MITKRNDKYVVMNSAGTRVLGTHKTHKDAVQQIQAIEASKHRKAK